MTTRTLLKDAVELLNFIDFNKKISANTL